MANRFKVSIEFEIEIDSISVPDADALLRMNAAGKDKKSGEKPVWSKEDFRKAMKQKGMSVDEIEKALAANDTNTKEGNKGKDGADGAESAEGTKSTKGTKGTKDTKDTKGTKDGQKRADPQMLLYPEYEAWAAAQCKLQTAMLADETLAQDYVVEMMRELTRGRLESLIDAEYGAPHLRAVLAAAMSKLSPDDQSRLKADEMSLLHDETELVDDAVACRFGGISITTHE